MPSTQAEVEQLLLDAIAASANAGSSEDALRFAQALASVRTAAGGAAAVATVPSATGAATGEKWLPLSESRRG